MIQVGVATLPTFCNMVSPAEEYGCAQMFDLGDSSLHDTLVGLCEIATLATQASVCRQCLLVNVL